jgi:tRNA1(Val) A37 N6-methylase TrmN6
MITPGTSAVEPTLGEDDILTDDLLTADFRLWQRKRGHRYSLDDVATAFEAARAVTDVEALCDLGCGIGSVLLMLGWKLPRARLVGVEAQRVSFELAQRNVARNGVGERTRLLHGDLRDEALSERLGERFGLITGTPPYQPPGTATPSPDSQRAHARIELRGGVEDYLLAASRLLVPQGRFVVCAEGRHPERVRKGADAARLRILRQLSVWPREGREHPLFHVFTLAPKANASAESEPAHAHFVARDAAGRRSDEYVAMRAFFGLPRTS